MGGPPPRRRGSGVLSGKLGVVVIAVLVLAAMAGTAAFVLRGRSDEDSARKDPPAPRPPPGSFFRERALGVAGIRPPGWRLTSTRRALRLRSPDRAGIVAVSAASSSVDPRALMTSTLAALGRSYRKVKLTSRRRADLGGRRGTAVSGSVTNSRAVRLDLLVSTAKGRRRTYLLQVFVARSAAGQRLGQAQALVNSLELTG